MRPVVTQALVYADDIVLIANNAEELQTSVTEWASTFKDKGMQLNTSKSKVMKVSKQPEREGLVIEWEGKVLEEVNTYEYLGTVIASDGTLDEEINNRLQKASKLYFSINNCLVGKREVSTKTKMLIYKTIYLPTLMYAGESWTMTSKHESRITSAEMRYLRKVVGKTRRDRVRNVNIRRELEQEPILSTLNQRQLKWFGHLVRMEEERLPKRIFEARVFGARGRGRPRMEWEGYMESLMERKGKGMREARRLALDRSGFREWAETPTPDGTHGRR